MSGMSQYAPFPEALDELVKQTVYKPGWQFKLREIQRDDPDTHGMAAGGLTLDIISCTYNSYRDYGPVRGRAAAAPDYFVHHYKIVPAATFNKAAWQRWILDCCIEIETHEACEFLRFGEDRPFAPTHGPGDNPYTIKELASDEQRRTSFKGVVKDKET